MLTVNILTQLRLWNIRGGKQKKRMLAHVRLCLYLYFEKTVFKVDTAPLNGVTHLAAVHLVSVREHIGKSLKKYFNTLLNITNVCAHLI